MAVGMPKPLPKPLTMSQLKDSRIQNLQRNDGQYSVIIERLEKGLQHDSSPVRNDPEPRMQLVVPTDLVHVVLEAFHDNDGHMGIDKTYSKIRFRISRNVSLVSCERVARKPPQCRTCPFPITHFKLLGSTGVGRTPAQVVRTGIWLQLSTILVDGLKLSLSKTNQHCLLSGIPP